MITLFLFPDVSDQTPECGICHKLLRLFFAEPSATICSLPGFGLPDLTGMHFLGGTNLESVIFSLTFHSTLVSCLWKELLSFRSLHNHKGSFPAHVTLVAESWLSLFICYLHLIVKSRQLFSGSCHSLQMQEKRMHRSTQWLLKLLLRLAQLM